VGEFGVKVDQGGNALAAIKCFVYLGAGGLLPTPKTRMEDCPAERERRTPNLEAMMGMGLLPTPQARDEKNGSKADSGRIARKMEQGYTIDLNDLAAMGALGGSLTGPDSQLSPQYTGEMMGFPPDWLELPFLATEGNQSKPTGMPLFRKLRCKSSKQSSKPKGK